MINLVTGLPGSGKTLFSLGKVNDLAIKENRQVYYHGIPDLTLPWQLMDSPEDWVNLPSNSIIVIDECQSTFRPRAASVKPPLYISEFETHRHKGLDFFLLTQHPMLIDSNIRRLSGKHYHVVRFYGFQKSTIHEFQSVRDNPDKNLKNSIATHFIFPKDVFNWYKSADAHTMKSRIPMRMVMLVILPLLLIGAIWYGVQVFREFSSQPEENMKALQNKGVIGATDANALPIQEVSSLDYVTARIPIVPDLPYTAPVYAELIKPKQVPYPAACVASVSNGCKCYTQQGTPYAIDVKSCLDIVQGGVFIDWQMAEQKTYSDHKSMPSSSRIIKGETLDAKLPSNAI